MSPSSVDLTEVIENSIDDASLPVEPTEAPETTPEPTSTESAPEGAETPSSPLFDDTSSTEVPSPAAASQAPVVGQNEFEKRFGLPAQSASGRENRIPYSRVQKIVTKAEKDAEARISKSLTDTHTSALAERDTKIQGYEQNLQKVAEFEQVMLNDHQRFLHMLAGIPGYQQIFQSWTQGAQPQAGQQSPVGAPQATPGMPQPDQALEDGTKVYSMEGLQALMEWQSKQVEERVTKQVQDRYAPIENEWQAQRRLQAMVPQIQSQINEARTWPQFSDNEGDIIKALQTNPQLSLEGAYRQVVFPKMTTDRNKLREELLAEIKAAPTSTSSPVRPTKPSPTLASGPRSIEDIIAESIQTLK